MKPPRPTPRQTGLIQQGIAHHRERRFVEAERCYQTVLRENPRHPDALNLMGLLAVEADRMPVAIDYLRRAVDIMPREPMYLNNLGNALVLSSQFAEAASHLRKAVKINPGFADAWANLGKCHRQDGDIAQARQCYEKALALQPGFLRARAGLAEAASELGNFDEAEAAFAAILKDDPYNVEALCGMSVIKRYAPDDPLFARIEAALAMPRRSEEDRASLHHALAKICSDAGDFDRAFEHYGLGKARTKPRFNLDHHAAVYAAMREGFTADFFEARRGFGSGDERPVFVVGMPRSGTTLVEQVLSAHSDVAGMGELPVMRRIAVELGFGASDPDDFPRKAAALGPEDCRALAARYLKAHARAPAKASRLIDKSPHNYEMLGLIALLFPNARIIHCRRDPMDTCVAVYTQNFSESHAYNRDLATLGAYYRCYEDLMDHWSANLPMTMHHHSYEGMVSDFEASARSLVDALDLDWDPECLNYSRHQRQVRTPSRWQVRQPIYRSSVGRWKRYERHLGPLKQALEQVASPRRTQYAPDPDL